MKKLFFAGAVALSLAAIAVTPVRSEKSNVQTSDLAYYQDTVPGKKKDTTKKPIPDSLGIVKR